MSPIWQPFCLALSVLTPPRILQGDLILVDTDENSKVSLSTDFHLSLGATLPNTC